MTNLKKRVERLETRAEGSNWFPPVCIELRTPEDRGREHDLILTAWQARGYTDIPECPTGQFHTIVIDLTAAWSGGNDEH